MSKLLCTDFLNNPAEYAQAESIWRDRWTELLHELGQQDVWECPWLNTTFANGTPFRDGNPIFSAICPSRQLAGRIIQIGSDADAELQTWKGTFGQDRVQELVIACPLTEQILDNAIQLMRRWITQEI